jgi:hypothetical protein
MAIRVELHYPLDNEPDVVVYLNQVPGVGEQVRTSEVAGWRFRVKHVSWDLTQLDSPSAHINAVRADVYLEAF